MYSFMPNTLTLLSHDTYCNTSIRIIPAQAIYMYIILYIAMHVYNIALMRLDAFISNVNLSLQALYIDLPIW